LVFRKWRAGRDNYAILGAQGCTPQACPLRDKTDKLRQLVVKHIYGVSTQDTLYQKEVREQLRLLYGLLSDEKLDFAIVLKLPTFEWQGRSLVTRLALAIENGKKILNVWYPVFRSDTNAKDVTEWLEARRAA
jgi:peroxiredoxin